MRLRHLALILCFCLGCKSTAKKKADDEGGPELPKVQALRDDPETGVPERLPRAEVVRASYAEITPTPAPAEDDALGQAAACVEKGDEAGAAAHLGRHVKAHPEQVMIRAYLAEVLLKLNRLPEAQDQFERFTAEAQERGGPAAKHVLHCHTRLMEIAQRRDDEYGEHLHRGIGMVLLARRLDAAEAKEEATPAFRERLLCRASAELTTAGKLRLDEPRPHWYLREVWSRLEQSRPAERELAKAKALATLMPLPPAEQKELVVACAACGPGA
jgi:predicted Zn-dependent protease